ncbi:MAG TPA: nitrate reductase associated protein [Candidatus Dormibacteraeota bacterium]|nr:nitrate reductase associated protein [Candidatus Dormibacteraeota bacterium]
MDDLELMPRSVRDKLDRVGLKLHLREWALLSLDERRRLVEAPCASDAEAARYAAELDALLTRYTGNTAERLAGRGER